MCSKTLGPATIPSFVTCPTIKMDIPSPFASRSRLPVVSLTWLTEPGDAWISSRYIVWIESITTSSGLSANTTASTRSRFVSASSKRFPEASESLSARILICWGDSSPDM